MLHDDTVEFKKIVTLFWLESRPDIKFAATKSKIPLLRYVVIEKVAYNLTIFLMFERTIL